MHLSNILKIWDVIDIGRYELGSPFGKSGFRMGITIASFNLGGMIPVLSDDLHNNSRGLINESLHFFIKHAVIPSGPHEFVLGSLFIETVISLSEISIFSAGERVCPKKKGDRTGSIHCFQWLDIQEEIPPRQGWSETSP